MAIGVIIGGAFGAITSSLVGNVITPLLAWLFGSPNTDALNIVLRPESAPEAGDAIILGLGTFVGAIVNFLIIALVLFLVIKAFNKAHELAEKKKAEEEAAVEVAPAPTSEQLLGEILEVLKNKQ
jgi:large conductance mechanosensitive channel